MALAADLYVSATGNDAGAGTKEQPFVTLAKARDTVRARIAGGMTADVLVEIAPGNYYHSEPLRFDERDGGRDGHSVIYRGAAKQGAKLYGGQAATQWEKAGDNLWRAPIARNQPLYQLIVDDQPAVMARFPKYGDGYSMSWCEGGKVPEAWRKWDFSDAQIVGYLGPNWFGDTAKITGVDPNTGQIASAGGAGYFGGMGPRRYIRGVLGLLTEPGEWCPQRKEGYVYYRPVSGEPKDHSIVVPTLKRLLDVRGSSADKPVQNVRFESLEFIGTDSFEAFGIPAVGVLDDGNVEGVVRIENACNITLRGCKVLGAGWIGVAMQHLAQDCEISNCLINHSGFNGIFANGYNPGVPPFKTAQEADVNFGHRIYNNAVLNSGMHMGHGAAIQFWQSGRNTVENNYLRRAPRYGVGYNGWPWTKGDKIYGIEVTDQNQYDFRYCHNNVVRYNDVGLVCRDSSDYGALQCWWPGRDCIWEFNAIHDVHADVDWDGWAHGVHPDDGVDYWTMRGCVLYFIQGGNATGGWMLKGQHQTADNNVLADSRMNRAVTAEPYGRPAFDLSNTHNIFACDVRDYYTGGGKDMARVFDFNVFWPPSPKVEGYRTWGAEKHSVCEDPQFVFTHKPWDRTWRDYDLKPSSPALKLGFKPIPMEKIGLRTNEFPFDLGAIERRSATRKIQAEDNDRVYHARNCGGSYVHHIEAGGWTKYENIDFGTQAPARIVAGMDYVQGQPEKLGQTASVPLPPLEAASPANAAAAGVAMEVRLDSVEGKLIGTFHHGQSAANAEIPVTGIHNIYLVFPRESVQSVNWFRFE